MRSTTVAFALMLAAGCGGGRHGGPGDDGSDGGGAGALTIMPADAVLPVDGTNPATLTYQVLRSDGADVTAQATFLIDDGKVGSFSGNVFTAPPGAAGKTTIHANVGGDTASTTIALKVTAVVIGPGAPADAPQKFGGPADAAYAPDPVYPPDGALMPPNLNVLELQWRPAQAELFEISFSGDALDLKVYAVCAPVGSGCALTPDEPTWNMLSQSGRGGTVQMTIRGTTLAGGPVGAAPPRSLSFADEDMKGGLYYWAAASGGLYRYDFGLRNQKAEAFYTPQQAGGGTMCVGCHALSRDGSRIAVGMNVPGPAQMRALDVATRKTLYEVGGGFGMGGSDFETLTADGGRLITTEGGGLTVRDGKSGAVMGATPAVANADMPDVSPDGKSIVFARGGGGMCVFGFCPTLSVQGASLVTVPFNGAGFGPEHQLVSGGGNNYYPSYSPDGAFVLFNRAAGDSYDAPDAALMVVAATGGQPIALASANTPAGNSWPKWAPFTHHFQGTTIFWLSFSSRRAYGLRQPMANGAPASQLWFVPVDAAKLAAGEDPGYPPLWLPFQDPTTGNHIAQWVEKVDRAPCSQIDQSGCMDNEMCVNGVCVPNPG